MACELVTDPNVAGLPLLLHPAPYGRSGRDSRLGLLGREDPNPEHGGTGPLDRRLGHRRDAERDLGRRLEHLERKGPDEPVQPLERGAPDAPAGIISQSFSQLVDVRSKTTEWLPSVNLNLWAFDEKVVFRLYGGKTSSPPSVNNLVPGGTCIIDQRDLLDGDTFGCTGRVGNPNLAPFSAWNYNASLEWYPNADTVFSAAYGKLDVKVGNPIQVTVVRRPFVGSDATDPISGEPLADYEFSVPTWANGPGYKRDIW